MKQIPETDDALVLRTDFSNQAIWDAICKAIREPVGIFRFRANVEFLSDPELTGLTKNQLLASLPRNYPHTFIIVVDEIAITHPEHAVLIVDLYERSGHEFRAIPSQVQGIENNLSIANMDFDEFADSVDEDGIFRGFQES
jgi:hypothetical protein